MALKEDQEGAMEPSPKWRTIVADDNRDSARTMALLLEHLGHEVEIVFDGAQALEAARRLRPQAMLLDLGMPKLDGYEVARRIRAEEGLEHILLIALTGRAMPEDRDRTHEAGFDVHLVKPVLLDQLKQVFLEYRSRQAP